MRLGRKTTPAIPLVILALGIAIPLAVRPGGRADVALPTAEAPRHAGRTAEEWRTQARRALARGRFDVALRRIKTAERIEPGVQFAAELAEVRTARWEARDVARARERLLGGAVEHLALDPRGAVLVAYRTAVVLPGESLWSLARGLVAAERGVPAWALPAHEPAVYGLWDRLTDLNGLRELEVGERVRIPLTASERDAIASANAADLARIDEGVRALARGDVGAAAALRGAIEGSFALGTQEFRAFDATLAAATERALVERARTTLRDALDLPRPSRHGELVSMLSAARDALKEAEEVAREERFVLEIARIETLLSQAARYRVLGDGSVVAVKPAGAAYTDVVRAAVEWFLDRELVRSGREFPHTDEKTHDEIEWARYLGDASDLARRQGIDFAALLESEADEVQVRLPNPGDYFER